MKQVIAGSLCAAIVVVLSPFSVPAQDNQKTNVNANQAQQEAAAMVPVHAVLLTGPIAKKSHAGEEIRAELERTVHLKNGRELPGGTQLVGEVTAVEAKPGDMKLALQFHEAQFKDGSKLPIKAMILVIEPPSSIGDGSESSRFPARDIWTPAMSGVDQLDAVSGADLEDVPAIVAS